MIQLNIQDFILNFARQFQGGGTCMQQTQDCFAPTILYVFKACFNTLNLKLVWKRMPNANSSYNFKFNMIFWKNYWALYCCTKMANKYQAFTKQTNKNASAKKNPQEI